MQAERLAAVIAAVAGEVIAHADELTALDQAIGDGDHGLNMKRGFQAVRDEAAGTAAKPLPDALKAIGTQLLMKVGGASGPLYATLLMALAKQTAPDGGNAVAALREAIEAVKARGKSQAGQKTMLDVLIPVHQALASGTPLVNLPGIADAAAAATVPMLAIRGRASFLGDRSIGHMDPGARSCALMITALCHSLEETHCE